MSDDVEAMYREPKSRLTVERLWRGWLEHVRTGESLDSILGLNGKQGQQTPRTTVLLKLRNEHLRELWHLTEVEHPEATDTEIAERMLQAIRKLENHAAAQVALYQRALGKEFSSAKTLLQALRKADTDIADVLLEETGT